jgi:Xaa-Pro aminopeptidase
VDAQSLWPGPAPQLEQDAFAARRDRVAAGLTDDQILVVATHEEALFSNDVTHRFRPHSDFWYLTGFNEPGAVMTLDSSGRYDMWMRARDPKAEVWDGRRLGLERADLLGVSHVFDSKEMAGLTRALKGRTILGITDHNTLADEAVLNAGDAERGAPILARHRMIKDAAEQQLLQRAADLGAAGMREGLQQARPGRSEFEVEAALIAHYRNAGSSGPGYPPIVGSGANAAILHYIENNQKIADGDLVLVDAGCEWGYYTSDITRTVPANGKFTKIQAQVYEAVWKAQEAALDKVRPGNRFKDPHDAAVASIIDSLVDMGHLKGDKDKLIEDQAQRPFFMHGTSHFLGLDVHDAGIYKDDEGESIKLEAGMCLTIEPGLYYNPTYAKVPPAAAHIGVRLENDVLVTPDGMHDMLASLPTAPDDIMDLMA